MRQWLAYAAYEWYIVLSTAREAGRAGQCLSHRFPGVTKRPWWRRRDVYQYRQAKRRRDSAALILPCVRYKKALPGRT